MGKLKPEHVNLDAWLRRPNIDVNRLGGKPIFRAFVEGSGSFIFKWEIGHTDLQEMKAMSGGSYDLGFDLMKQARGGSGAGRMATAQELRTFCEVLTRENLMDQNVTDAVAEERPLFVMQDLGQTADIGALVKSKNKWSMVDKVKTATETDQEKLDRKLAALGMLFSLQNVKYLERLGRIMAVDLFLGNTDRFNPYINEDRVIPSPQNVIFKMKSKQGEDGAREVYYSISGLDMNDPNGSWAKLDQDLLACRDIQIQKEAMGDEPWPGLYLNDKSYLKAYAQRVLRALIVMLKELLADHRIDNMPMFAIGKKGSHKGDEKHVLNGIAAAKEQIKGICMARLNTNLGRAGAPAGLRSRMKALKWIK